MTSRLCGASRTNATSCGSSTERCFDILIDIFFLTFDMMVEGRQGLFGSIFTWDNGTLFAMRWRKTIQGNVWILWSFTFHHLSITSDTGTSCAWRSIRFISHFSDFRRDHVHFLGLQITGLNIGKSWLGQRCAQTVTGWFCVRDSRDITAFSGASIWSSRTIHHFQPFNSLNLGSSLFVITWIRTESVFVDETMSFADSHSGDIWFHRWRNCIAGLWRLQRNRYWSIRFVVVCLDGHTNLVQATVTRLMWYYLVVGVQLKQWNKVQRLIFTITLRWSRWDNVFVQFSFFTKIMTEKWRLEAFE